VSYLGEGGPKVNSRVVRTVVSNLMIQGLNLAGGDSDGFSVLGAIRELRVELMVWVAVERARCIRLLGSIGR
jgi:hypothetical protein